MGVIRKVVLGLVVSSTVWLRRTVVITWSHTAVLEKRSSFNYHGYVKSNAKPTKQAYFPNAFFPMNPKCIYC